MMAGTGTNQGSSWVGVALIGTVMVATLMSSAATADAPTVREVFDQVKASVVVIKARGHDVTAGGQSRFKETGSGVLVTPDGKVMTAAHVVHSMDQIDVEFLGGETVPARVIASEPAADLSLLQLDKVPANAKVAKMGDSNQVHVGDPVIIVGAPYGLSYSLSAGYISARWPPNTVYKTMPLAEFFQTTATINTGNSGGPMFAMNGDVIGIVSHNISKSGGSEGLGFVVTMNTARQLLLEKKSFWGGLEGVMLSDELADMLNLPPRTTGYIVKTVAKDSPGDLIGLRGAKQLVNIGGEEVPLGGDIILSVDGIQMTSANVAKIRDQIGRQAPGTPYKVTILRAGQVIDLTGKTP
jgi:S1-C subfamily serine protease